MEIMMFMFSIGFVVGAIVAGIAFTLHDREPENAGIWYNEETNTFYFVD